MAEQRLGRYTIEKQLGEGSFAYVYRARDEDLHRSVALKVLKPVWLTDPNAINRFKREARTMARLDKNPNIAVVYEVGEDQGQVFLAQLLVDGETLTERLLRGPLSWPGILDILRPVASALDYAHSQGVIHRDIKPSNILLDAEGRPYVGDFWPGTGRGRLRYYQRERKWRGYRYGLLYPPKYGMQSSPPPPPMSTP